jgi:hypothetical protein
MSYENGKVTKPIGIPDIQKAVGYSSGDLGTLIDKGIINAYSAVKPVRSAAHQIDDYSTVDISYGFNLNEIITPSLNNAFNNCRQYKYWEKFYLRPRGVQITDTTIEQYVERYRFLDFNGYWKYAPHPYKYNNIEDIVFYGTKNNFKNTPQSFSFSINSKAEIFITSFKALLENGDESTLSEWKYGMLVGDSGGTLSFVAGDSLTDTSTNDPTADDVTKSFGVMFNDTGKFSLCFVATKYTGGDDTAVKTAWLDGGFHTVNISQIRIPIDVPIITFNGLSVQKTTDADNKTTMKLMGLPSTYNLTLKMAGSSSNYNNTVVISTTGGLEVYVDFMNQDDAVIDTEKVSFGLESFEYSGEDPKEIAAALVDDPIIGSNLSNDDINRISYFKIRITPYTNATDDNNGQFRWTNGAASQEYRVNFQH